MFIKSLLLCISATVAAAGLSWANPLDDIRERLNTSQRLAPGEWLQILKDVEGLFSLDTPTDALRITRLMIRELEKSLVPRTHEMEEAIGQMRLRLREKGRSRIHDSNPQVRLAALDAVGADRDALEQDVRALMGAALTDSDVAVRNDSTNRLWVVYMRILDRISGYSVLKDREDLAYDVVRTLIRVRDLDADRGVRSAAIYSLKAIETQILQNYFVHTNQASHASLVLSIRTLAKFANVFTLEHYQDHINIGSRAQIMEKFLHESQSIKDELTDRKVRWEQIRKIAGACLKQQENHVKRGTGDEEGDSNGKAIGSFDDLPLDWNRIRTHEHSGMLYQKLLALIDLISGARKAGCQDALN